MFLHKDEELYFRQFLIPDKSVLEYGSGESTIQIAQLVKHVVSIEHDSEWVKKLKDTLPSNVYCIFSPPATPYTWATNKDGNLSQFANYVMAPLRNMERLKGFNDKVVPYDLIFIDGRARPYCAQIAPLISHKDTIVFIHDFQPQAYEGRANYVLALESLTFVEKCHDLARFTVKPELIPNA